jgi:hypothetical protein
MTTTSLEDLDYLIEKAKEFVMSEAQLVEQRRSFAYGNTAFENPRITRRMVNDEAEKIGL